MFSCFELQAGTSLILTAFVSVDAHYDVEEEDETVMRLVGLYGPTRFAPLHATLTA